MATHRYGALPSDSSQVTSNRAEDPYVNVISNDNGQLLSQSGRDDASQEKVPHSDIAEQRQGTTSQKSVFKLWWQEILSISFSTLCLGANVAVLASLDQKPYESWRVARVDITPNAIVSIFATFNKASLLLPIAEIMVQLKWLYFQARMQKVSDLQLFDDASRGPLGSMRLLWKVHLRVRKLILAL